MPSWEPRKVTQHFAARPPCLWRIAHQQTPGRRAATQQLCPWRARGGAGRSRTAPRAFLMPSSAPNSTNGDAGAPPAAQACTATGSAAGERFNSGPFVKGGANGGDGGGNDGGGGAGDGALSLPPSPSQSSKPLPSAGESAAGVRAMTRMLTWLCCSRAAGTNHAGRRRRSGASSPLPF